MTTTNNIPPVDLDPTGDICIPLTIPNNWEWLWTVHKALSIPTLQRYWQDDYQGTPDIIRRNWESRVMLPFADNIINAITCAGNEESLGECFRMDTTTEAFEFYPNDPFTDPNNNSGNAIATSLKWTRWADAGINGLPYAGEIIGDVLGLATGYFPNDIMLTLDLLSPFDSPIDRLQDIYSGFTSFWFPTVFIELEGEGQFEIELVSVPFGGTVLLIPDLEFTLDELLGLIIEYIDFDGELPALWKLVEVNRALTAFPPELSPTSVHEFEFEGNERHTLHAVFIPRVSVTPPFYQPFGGIREIEACGNLKIIGSNTGEIIDQYNYKLEQHTREGFIMSTVSDICEGVVCALEEVSSRILLSSSPTNIVGGVNIGKDGGSIFDLGSKPTPENITGLQSYSGIIDKLVSNVQQYITDFEDLYQAYPMNQSVTLALLSEKYDSDPDRMTLAVSGFYTWRDGSGGALASPNASELFNALYCGSPTLQATKAYIVDSALSDKEVYVNMLSGLNSSQFDLWRSESSTPSNSYQSSGCYQQPPVNYTFTVDNGMFIDGSFSFWRGTSGVFPNLAVGGTNRKLQVKFEGVFTHAPTGRKSNMLWFINTSDAPQSHNMSFSTNGGTTAQALDNYPSYVGFDNPYYSFITTTAWLDSVDWGARSGWAPEDVTGSVKITLQDLGAV